MNPLVDGVSEVRGLSQSASAPVPGSGVLVRKGGDNGRPKSMGPEGGPGRLASTASTGLAFSSDYYLTQYLEEIHATVEFEVTRYKFQNNNDRAHFQTEKCVLVFHRDTFNFQVKVKNNVKIEFDYLDFQSLDIGESDEDRSSRLFQREEQKKRESRISRVVPPGEEKVEEYFVEQVQFWRKYDFTVAEGEKIATIKYGNTFLLNLLFVSASADTLCRLYGLVMALRQKKQKNWAANSRIGRWITKSFSEITGNANGSMNYREFKIFVQEYLHINQQDKFKDWFRECDRKGENKIYKQAVLDIFKELAFDTNLSRETLEEYNVTNDGLKFEQFIHFHHRTQKQDLREDKALYVLQNMLLGARFNKAGWLSLVDFDTFLFSRQNEITLSTKDSMHHALNNYWINSSHNTYLLGNQLNSKSDVEAYTKVLLDGCRCVELDVWDGPNNQPIITHGHTMCTKIKLVDVLYAINDAAFKNSQYPVILSIENHTCKEQQVVMVNMFKQVFGTKLLVQDLAPLNPKLPSPEQLKNKIIIKNKKLGTGESHHADIDDNDENDEEMNEDIYMDSRETEAYREYEVYLNENLEGDTYAYRLITFRGPHIYVSEEMRPLKATPETLTHHCNYYYFGNVTRIAAEQTVKNFIRERFLDQGLDHTLGNGCFMVRKSSNLYMVVCVYHNNTYKHIKLFCEPRGFNMSYYIVPEKLFDTVEEVCQHYSGMYIARGIRLKYGIPNPDFFKHKTWYKGDIGREQAETILRTSPLSEGKYLVRERSGQGKSGYVLSFISDGRPVHAPVTIKGASFEVGREQFQSLNDVVEHYAAAPVYKSTMLTQVAPDIRRTQAMWLQRRNVQSLIVTKDYKCIDDDGLSLLKGFRLHNGSRAESILKADLGLIRGAEIPDGVIETLKEENPLGELLKFRISLADKISINVKTNPPLIVITFKLSVISIKFNTEVDMRECLAEIHNVENNQAPPRNGQLSQELSDLVVYCQAVHVPKPFVPENFVNMNPYEMCSFTELTFDKFMKDPSSAKALLRFTKSQLSRMYPKWSRQDSSNYNPMMPWAYGMQMVALNFQMNDVSMQLNRGMFSRNHGCGYVLKPQFMRNGTFDPSDPVSMREATLPCTVIIKVLTGRLITMPEKKWNKGDVWVSASVYGIDADVETFKTCKVKSPGMSPDWRRSDIMRFPIQFPQLAVINFTVYKDDNFSSEVVLAQRCVPVCDIQEGYRSIPLQNVYGEELELATILVHVSKTDSSEADNNHFSKRALMNVKRLKALELNAMILNGLKRGTSTEEELQRLQSEMDKLTKEVLDFKYPDAFIASLENPLANADPLPGF